MLSKIITGFSAGRFARIAKHCYESPVVTTWASLTVKFLNYAIVLPLALNKLGVAELNLWLLFFSFSALGMLLDFGFSATFIRFVAYSREAGSRENRDPGGMSGHRFSDYQLAEIVGAIVFVYRRLSLASGLFLLIIGTLAIAIPLAQVPDASSAWLAWVATIIGTTLTLHNSMYSAFLQGSDKIALYRRWEAISGMFSIVAALICLILSSSLLCLVIALQVAPVVGAVVYKRLVNRFDFDQLKQQGVVKSNRQPVIAYVWGAAWRSGLGVAATMGSLNGGNILLAQFLPASMLAPYLLAQRLIAATVVFASPQFHTAIPRFVSLFKKGSEAELIGEAGRRIVRTNWSLSVALVILAFVGPYLLQLIDSNVTFVAADIWLILSISAIFERSGAMHIQLFSLANKINWHIANGVTGAIVLSLLYPAFLVAHLRGVALISAAAYGLFYMPYCMVHSYRQFSLSPQRFDIVGVLGPLVFVAVFGGIAMSVA